MIVKLNKSSFVLLVIVLTVISTAATPMPTATTPTNALRDALAPTNLTIDGAVTYQTMNGVGSNVNSWSWKKGEIRPALDMLIDTLGHNIFRVVHDRME